ncbi:hypothetical protein Pmani_022778 [Petrolisthes manimaculis]|uniref:Multidrug resistance-associated protein 1 n=1 Tax=Petrolisthes manimaculis TaxID=1843537 RepID=A0AAE1U0U3_9EUCA|nr:hypothetical protein Pmani_022778 [Petrolisthes manimaculis]
MDTEEEGPLFGFCGGSPLWDGNLTWYTDNPKLTPCFESTILVWIPCGVLWLLSPLETHLLLSSRDKHIPWSWLNVSKIVGSTLLIVLELVELFYSVHQWSLGEEVYGVHFLTPLLLSITFVLQFVFVLVGRHRGQQTSVCVFFFWLAVLVCGLPEFIGHLTPPVTQLPAVGRMYFISYLIYYVLVVFMFILNCFADNTPLHLDTPRGKNHSPELCSSFLNHLTFSWFNALIWRGYRTPLEHTHLWDLTPQNTSCDIVAKWDENWRKTTAKAFKRGESRTYASFNNDGGEVSVSGVAGDKHHYLSILPTMIRTFLSSFLWGALMKLSHDIVQYISPQILSALINFVEDESEMPPPFWHGYAYSVLLLLCTLLQSFLLGHYFKRMRVIGLQVRTGIISAVYRKALRISNSARKESTVGEIVNLMSVDAQRFMDIATYINMIWSAPLQIALALYFLWGMLGPSVLAGLAVMVALIPINGLVANRNKVLEVKQMKCKDNRIRIMNEILNGIKVLKLYGWESAFETQVREVRGKEIKLLRQSAYMMAGTNFIWSCTPFLVSLASFATFVYLSPDNVLDANIAFVSLSLFNLLRFPFVMLPLLISSMVQANVSLKRINKFMNADELDPNCVTRNNTESKPVVIENGTFAWGADDEGDKNTHTHTHTHTTSATLHNINLHITEGSLIAVVGSVGAGKSSLCSAILGEMECQAGKVNVKGNVAYVPQEAWIQNATLENNILFNQPKDNTRYEQCIKSCALSSDLDVLPAGDQTEIGEKGINLSGGQKQRVSLARAVFADADVYLLDDPLSAVDAHVGKHIFNHVIGPQGQLNKKTRLLVTHGLTYLPQVDNIVVLKDGVISEQGNYQQLLAKKGPFQDFLLQYLASPNEDVDDLGELKQELESSLGREVVERQLIRHRKESESDSIVHGDAKYGRNKRASENETLPPLTQTSEGSKNSEKIGETLIKKEKAMTGKVQLGVYKYYLSAVGLRYVAMTLVFNIICQMCIVGSAVWLGVWSEEESNDPYTRDYYLGIYGAFGFGQAISGFVADIMTMYCMVTAAYILHNNLLSSIMRLPQSFFDTNPVGRILNRFSKDTDAMDRELPQIILDLIWCFLEVLATMAVIIYATPIFVVVMIPMMIIYFSVQVIYVSTSRQLKRLESVSLSPIYSHFQESIQGASSIRAYNRRQEFILESEQRVDYNQVCAYPTIIASRWLALRLELIGNMVTFSAAMFAVMNRDSISGGKAGLSITYALSVTQTLNWLVQMVSSIETSIVAVERIKEYMETPQEAPWQIIQHKPHKDWPQEGVVEFNHYSTRYRQGLQLVLRNINFKINKCEKIGIVGRTGAGKSSLTLALFRLIEKWDGNITIDNINISTLGLHDLRSRLTIIPQDAVLFSGTLRMNLDPLSEHSDDKVWCALEHAHLKHFVTTLSLQLQHPITEGGENLSVGQRQLVCLARALLRKTKVLVLDEATAAVDLETDALIQNTIIEEFNDCTIITIAHRINTIMDSNRVLVLDNGEIREYDTPATLLQNHQSIFYSMAKDAGLV